MKTIVFFNNKGGVGKTSLVYHLSWMFAEHGVKTLAIDLDPQANLSAMFLDDAKLAQLWEDDTPGTVYDALLPLIDRTGDIDSPYVETIHHNLWLVPGHLALSQFEDLLAENWPQCLDSHPEAAFRVTTAFFRIMQKAASANGVELVLIDVGSNLGAINRAAVIAAENVVIPLTPDFYSLQGMKNLGPCLMRWRRGWKERLRKLPDRAEISVPSGPSVPGGEMQPVGYVVMRHSARDSGSVLPQQQWRQRIPEVYREFVLDEKNTAPPELEKDPDNLALFKYHRSLMAMALDVHKPVFFLKNGDGAIGSHIEAVKACYDDFSALAGKIAQKTGLTTWLG